MIIVKLEKVHLAKKKKRNDVKMKRGRLKAKFLAVFAALFLLSTPTQNALAAIAPNSRNVVSYYSQHLQPKFQNINGPCWAFAGMATLETFLHKKGLLNESLSEKHLLSWANQAPKSYGWHVPISRGGSSIITKGYLMSGAGPVSSRMCPYTTSNDTYSAQMSSCKPQYWIKGIKDIEPDINSIKQAVSEYGAVAIAYQSSRNLNHSVSVIGWDDDTKEWIVKDSSSRPNNYIRLPFKTKILDSYCITDAEPFNANQKIYQHDQYGVTGGISCDRRLIVANVFDFSGNETLDSVTICSDAKNAQITLYCAPTASDGTPYSNSWTWVPLYSGTIPYSGYSTFKLTNQPKLSHGKYAIIAQIEKTNHSDRPSIGCQKPIDILKVEPNTRGRSFVLQGFDFVDAYSRKEPISAFSIKAVTIR